MDSSPLAGSEGIDLTEDDIIAAMREIPGYLDITPRDFKEIYVIAYQQALARLSREITAADIMTREVATVREDTPLAEVAAVMGARGIAGLPVLASDDKVVGVISEKDFLARMGVLADQNFMSLVAHCLASKGCVALPIKNQQAKDLMTSPAEVISPALPVQEIAALFRARKINRVPVVDDMGRILGIVSRADLIKALYGESKPC